MFSSLISLWTTPIEWQDNAASTTWTLWWRWWGWRWRWSWWRWSWWLTNNTNIINKNNFVVPCNEGGVNQNLACYVTCWKITLATLSLETPRSLMKSNKSSEFSGFSITYQLAMRVITEFFSSQKFKTILKSDTCSVDNEHEIRLTRMKQSERSYQSSSWTTWSHGCTLLE